MKKILIYRDEGVDPFGLSSLVSALKQEKLELISWADRKLLQKDGWQKDTRLLIIPGGRDIPYHEALKGDGNRRIADFVHEGGSYLGICAGAYYGSALIEFEQGGPLEVLATRELKFFPGLARGPAYGLGKFCYQSGKGSQIARMLLSNADLSAAYFNGGCSFVNADKYDEVHVLARYADIEEQPVAIVHCKVGQGRAILCGVHPEYSANFSLTQKNMRGSQLAELTEAETMRRALFQRILMELL